MGRDRLIYIGKSNKKFTYSKEYKYYSLHYLSSNEFNMTVYYNSSQMVTFKDKDYFDKNFKLILSTEFERMIRKLKIKKIEKNEGF